MKFGVISDVHANLPALQAVLNEFMARQVDRVICLGDMIGIGPHPDACVNTIMALKDPIVLQGNHEQYFANGIDPDTFAAMSREEREHHRWQWTHMGGKAKLKLLNLPTKLRFDCEGVTISASHYGMDVRGDILPTATAYTEANIQDMFGMDSHVYLFGHDHHHFVREFHGQTYICVGSAGCPEDELGVAVAGILEVANGDFAYDSIAVPYDIKQTVKDAKRQELPDCDFICNVYYHTV